MGKNDRICAKQNNNACNDKGAGNMLTSCFFSLPAKQFSLLSSLIGILFIDNLDLNQQNSLGNFIVSVGQAILTASAQGQLLQSSNPQTDDRVHQQIQLLKKQICALEEELNKQN